MADNGVSKLDSLIAKIAEEIHGCDSSSSGSDAVKSSLPPLKSKIYRLFGRERPVHKILGGGRPADVLLWKDSKISAGVFGGVTAVWYLFEVLEYHLLTFICHALMVSLAILFLWANCPGYTNKAPRHVPDVVIPERPVLNVASAMINEIDRAIATLQSIASGRDLKKFLSVIGGLWIISILGSCCNFLTFFYICFLLLHTLPLLYENYEDEVDAFAEKAVAEADAFAEKAVAKLKKQYAVVVEKVLSMIPGDALKDKMA